VIDHRDLQNIIKRIVALYNPELIYLFGSCAKGKMTERSDLDFIVVKRTGLPRHLRGRDVVAVLAEFAVDIDILFVTPDEIEMECNKPHSLLETVMPRALLLYRRWPTPVFLCDDGILGSGGKEGAPGSNLQNSIN
jgi:predicted nucleotidyltransferase